MQIETDAIAELRELMTLMTGDEKHTDAATSTLDVLWRYGTPEEHDGDLGLDTAGIRGRVLAFV
ncbi:MAG TPA: hypothetical protein VGJ77_02675 [Gaiellaceae bacterium]|jgi:hypothetical protein